jgi:hypothetical protein
VSDHPSGWPSGTMIRPTRWRTRTTGRTSSGSLRTHRPTKMLVRERKADWATRPESAHSPPTADALFWRLRKRPRSSVSTGPWKDFAQSNQLSVGSSGMRRRVLAALE